MNEKPPETLMTRKQPERSSHRLRIEAEWLGIRQATEYASVSERTLREWIHAPCDPLPAVRVAGKLLLKRSDLDAWLISHRITATSSLDLDAIVKSVMRGPSNGR